MKKRDFAIVLLILLNLALITKVLMLKNSISTRNAGLSPDLLFVPHFSLFDLNKEAWSTDMIVRKSPYAMLVFFSPQDCSTCLLESSLWKYIYEHWQITVIGVARHMNERELRIWVENEKITFPVLFDRGGQVTNLFQLRSTPQKIIIDNFGKVLVTDAVRIGQSEFDEFLQLLKKTIG